MTRRGWLAALAWLLAACSVLVDGEHEPVRCAQEGQAGPPACDEGLVCRDGRCQALAGSAGAAAEDAMADAGAPHAGDGLGERRGR